MIISLKGGIGPSDNDGSDDDDDNDDANLVDVTLSNREAAAHQGISPPLGHHLVTASVTPPT